MKTLILFSTLAFGVTPISSTATAAPAPVVEESPATEKVRYDDLDLSEAKDQARLKRRITRAAARVCEETLEVAAYGLSTQVNRSCYRAAMKDAMARMDRVVARSNDKAMLAVTAAK